MLSQKTKRSIIIAVIAVILLTVIYLAVGRTYQKPVVDEMEEKGYPSGYMTGSIFDYQNMERTSFDVFTKDYSFSFVPVSIRLPQGTTATSGGALFTLYDDRYLMVSEYEHGTDAGEDIVKMLQEQITGVLKSGADPQKTQIEILSYEEGFINGCEGRNYTIRITPESAESCYMSLYELWVCDLLYESENEIFLGCISSGSSYDYFSDRYRYATALAQTMQIDEKAKTEMNRKKDAAGTGFELPVSMEELERNLSEVQGGADPLER